MLLPVPSPAHLTSTTSFLVDAMDASRVCCEPLTAAFLLSVSQLSLLTAWAKIMVPRMRPLPPTSTDDDKAGEWLLPWSTSLLAPAPPYSELLEVQRFQIGRVGVVNQFITTQRVDTSSARVCEVSDEWSAFYNNNTIYILKERSA